MPLVVVLIFLRASFTLTMDYLDIRQVYFDLGLRSVDIIWVLAAKHNVVLSLRSLKCIIRIADCFTVDLW